MDGHVEHHVESVWDYPRPPRVEDSGRHVEVYFHDRKIADSTRAKRVLETSHPPAYYIPREDILTEFLRPSEHRTWCEWKGQASYFDIVVGATIARDAAWTYVNPVSRYDDLRGYLAFYPGKVDACFLDGERVSPEPESFYGGWVTRDIQGPFAGEGPSHW